ncbi:MAG: lipid biosynthesis B12-binding/radical SAM protein [Candidatus Electrothrix communis]|nr:MAG: lipid biosynthesis B12-binding/radical SAM protein [Candidatus Electrothrix communis]
MRVLLISPNTLTVPYPVYPIGLDYVASSIPAHHAVRIADCNVLSREALGELLSEYQPEVIGISCRNIDNTEAGDPLCFINVYKELVSWLRSRTQAILVCGGSGFNIMPEKILPYFDVDYGLVGEGERFGLLVEALDKKQEPSEIPGVLAASSCSPDIPTEKAPPWDGQRHRTFQQEAEHYRFYLEHGGMLNLQTKRGCSFRCVYCPYPHIEGKKHRLVDPQQVAKTALELEAAGAKYLFLTDSAFNSDIDHSLAVAKAFQKAGLTIPWGGFFAPIKLPVDYFTVMADAGLAHVEFGTESLSDAMLKNYRKPFRVQEVLTAHQQALDAGLHTAHYFLLGGPGESADTINESLENREQLKKTVTFYFVGIRIYPGTGLYDIALEEGKINETTDLLQPVFYEPDLITREQIDEMVTERAGNRINWIVGSGGARAAEIVSKMHSRGYVGPLWEYLIR